MNTQMNDTMTQTQRRIADLLASVDSRSDSAAKAAVLRKVLRLRFPDTKFSVRTSRYAGGSSVSVQWMDGPTRAEVDVVCSALADIDRDHYSGEILSGSKFVHAERRYSAAAWDAMRAHCETYWADWDEQLAHEQHRRIYQGLERTGWAEGLII